MANLSDLMAEEEARRLAEMRKEIAAEKAEKAAWDALSEAERKAIIHQAFMRMRSLIAGIRVTLAHSHLPFEEKNYD